MGGEGEGRRRGEFTAKARGFVADVLSAVSVVLTRGKVQLQRPGGVDGIQKGGGRKWLREVEQVRADNRKKGGQGKWRSEGDRERRAEGR